MRKKRKVVRRKRSLRTTIEKRRIINNVIKILAIATIVFIIYAWNSYNSNVVYGIMPLYDAESAKNTPLNEFVDFAEKNDLSLYLPSVLPYDFKLTFIYLKESPFIGMVVYSAEGNKDYRTAELVFEIAPAQLVPTLDELESEAKDSPYISVLTINGWVVCIMERADSGGNPEFRRKYGDYTLILRVWIDELEYWIVAPTLTKADGIQLVGNMRMLTT